MELEKILKKKAALSAKLGDIFTIEEIKQIFKDFQIDYPRCETENTMKQWTIADVLTVYSGTVKQLKEIIEDTADRLSTPEEAYNDVFDVLDSLRQRVERWLDR